MAVRLFVERMLTYGRLAQSPNVFVNCHLLHSMDSYDLVGSPLYTVPAWLS